MSAIILMLIAIVATTVAYFTYGTFVANRLQISDANPTPANTMNDGVDYVPARAPVVLGHHFASIAGAGPIVGPIVAITFGWLPAFLWILFGVIFIGAVHDSTALTASLRHGGKSIGELIEEYVGSSGKKLFIIFAFSALILVIGVFGHVVAQTFITTPAVATSSLLFIALAVTFGIVTHKMGVPLVPASIVGVAALFACVWIGMEFPLDLFSVMGLDPAVEADAKTVKTVWTVAIMGYIFIAAVTPVWALLQPRDYLNSYLLYAMMLGGIVGLFVAQPTLQMDAVRTFNDENLGFIFPILFVTVACGAISGFHSLVASGTTSKQIAKESDAKVVGYGGMLIEGVLAVLALIAAGIMTHGDYAASGNPIAIFAGGVGGFMGSIGISETVGVTFVALAVSAFALTSLDTCTRLARFLFQEFFDRGEEAVARGEQSVLSSNRFVGTGIVVVAGGALTLSGQWQQVWPIFGSANQLLAALALLAVAVWLSRKGVKNGFVLLPMAFMFVVTLAALGQLFVKNLTGALGDDGNGSLILAGFAAALFALAIVLLVQSLGVLRRGRDEAIAPAE